MGKKFDYGDYGKHLYNKEKAAEEGAPSSKIRYYIDEEDGVTVAVMEDCEYDAIDILTKMGITGLMYQGFNLDKFMMNTTYRGKAICSPEDIWDEEEGMRIARNRMLENYYRARTLALMRAENVLTKMMDELGSRIDYSDMRYQKAYNGTL